ncbi:hypothetical protein [Dolichospermum sp. UHCC 0259]|uniref:hypothetical protein n=1 Tax=Dolichospermum sp. UHCC 0259 TaxID=2590010 RepID=UPI0014477D75|nr:hypothetical protein [Dolichospermum sp. UHCC 0259]MTJ47860.1 hypothetical protein [Dolichospermum sp. UHCC 0259]
MKNYVGMLSLSPSHIPKSDSYGALRYRIPHPQTRDRTPHIPNSDHTSPNSQRAIALPHPKPRSPSHTLKSDYTGYSW